MLYVTRLQVRIDGLTGHIQFNEKGRRTNYTVSIMELAPSGPKKVSPAEKDLFVKNGIIMYTYDVDEVTEEPVLPPSSSYPWWFSGWLLEWRGEVRQHCQFCERQQRHLRPPEQDVHRHNHPGESVVTWWGKWQRGICVSMGLWAETEQL